ncbi:MAG: hypothetical protein AAGJ35_00340 [Myxococcota bacterium]
MNVFRSLTFTLLLVASLTHGLACGPPPAPEPPSDFETNTDKNADGQIVLYWKKHPNPQVTGYRVYRDTQQTGDFSTMIYEGSAIQYIDTDVLRLGGYETDVYYKISATIKTADGQIVEGTKSNLLSAQTKNFTRPAPPKNLEAKAENLSGQGAKIRISWTPNTEVDIKRYLIFRIDAKDQRVNSSNPNQAIGNVPHRDTNLLFFDDTEVEVGKYYTYTVVAEDSDARQPLRSENPSDVRVFDIALATATLSQPQNDGLVQKNSLNFSWNAVDSAAGYTVSVFDRPVGGRLVWRSSFTTTTTTSYNGPTLGSGRKYYWLVDVYSERPTSEEERGTSDSPLWSFEVQ